MDYEQLELPFEYDGNDYETAQSVYLDEPAYDWRTRAEAAEDELDEMREALSEALKMAETGRNTLMRTARIFELRQRFLDG